MNIYEKAIKGLMTPDELKEYIAFMRRNVADLRASAIRMSRDVDALDRVYAQRPEEGATI